MLQHSSLQIKTIFWRYLCWRITLLSTGFCPILRDPHRPPNQNEQYHTPLLSQIWDLSDRHQIVGLLRGDSDELNIIFASNATETLYNRRREVVLTPQSSIYNPQSSVLNPRSSVLNPRSSILGPHSSLLNPRSSVLNPQSLVLGPQAVISCTSVEAKKSANNPLLLQEG